MLEAITGEPYRAWITREIIDAVGLSETTPDMPLRRGTPFARGHSGRILLGRRVVIPGDNPTHAIAPAGGFVSTAGDIARFFAQLSPNARKSVLSAASRREMSRRHWRNPMTAPEQHYGLGTISGSLDGWDWFGHSGGLQGYISRTCVYPSQELTVCVLTNAIDGWAHFWVDGIANILQGFAREGAPTRKVQGWSGRWWSLWAALDLVPVGNKVLALAPGFIAPMTNAPELEITGRTTGRIAKAPGFGSHGEPVSCVRTKSGRIVALQIAGTKFLPADKLAREMRRATTSRRAAAQAGREGAMNQKINLAEKLATFAEHWSPRTVAQLNDHDVMVVKVQGEFVWHKHDETDDFFLVLKGELDIELRDRTVTLGPGEMFIVPKGVEHRPVAREEAHLLLIEPTGTPNTGDAKTAAPRKLA